MDGRAGNTGGGNGGGRGGAGTPTGAAGDDQQDDAAAAFGFARGRQAPNDGGGLTPLVYAARANDVESVKVLLAAGADINQTSAYGWSPLLVATQNRYYKLGAYLLERGANPNLANKGGWVPLYLATDNRNIESGDYPVRKGDMDHLEFIKLLLDKGANVNARVKDSTETRTVFTNQWLDENGATAFLRASQSGDIELMKLLLARGADPKIATTLGVTALHVAAGIGWVEGITYRMVAEGDARRGEDADRSRSRCERRRPTPAGPQCTAPRTRAALMWCRSSSITAPSSISETTGTPTTAAASSRCTRGSRWTMPMASCASACSRRLDIRKLDCSFAN